MDKLKVKTIDNKKFTVEANFGKLSVVIQNCFDTNRNVLYLVDIVGVVFEKVIKFCHYHLDNPEISDWDYNFVNGYCNGEHDVIAYTTLSGETKMITMLQSLLISAKVLKIDKLTEACRYYIDRIKLCPPKKVEASEKSVKVLPEITDFGPRVGLYIPCVGKPRMFDYNLSDVEFHKILNLKQDETAGEPIFHLEDHDYMLAVFGYNGQGSRKYKYNTTASKITRKHLYGDCLIVDDNINFNESELNKLLEICKFI